jgi:hypothetical protein
MAKFTAISQKANVSEYRLVYVASFKGVYLSPPFPTLDALFSKRTAMQRSRRRRGLPPFTHIASFVPIR